MKVEEILVHRKEYFCYIDECEIKNILLRAVTKEVDLTIGKDDKVEVNIRCQSSLDSTTYSANVSIIRSLLEEKAP
jgi:hypothetical protein